MIQNPDVQELSDEALRFLESHSWCGQVHSGELAFAIAGVVGIFKFSFEPTRPEVDSSLWVITGDLPPAYLVTDDAPDWQSALSRYVYEMRKWVVAARGGASTAEMIPVNATPTSDYAELLERRLKFFERELIAVPPENIGGDA